MHLFQTLNEAGNTIVLVTHEREIADHAARRILFRDGKVIEDVAVADRRFVRQ
jgi:putative ABC transport system ATP-binding protein